MEFTKEMLESYEYKTPDMCMIVGCRNIAVLFSDIAPELCFECYKDIENGKE
jgi:hypothetical protein